VAFKQPSTLMNKIRKLTSAVNFVNFIENPHGKNQELSSQCQELSKLGEVFAQATG